MNERALAPPFSELGLLEEKKGEKENILTMGHLQSFQLSQRMNASNQS